MKETMLIEISLKVLIYIFTTIIGAENLNGGSILGTNHRMECFEDIDNLIFMFHQVEPCHTGRIIHKNNKPTNAGHIRHQ
jgi:hypothetical protein